MPHRQTNNNLVQSYKEQRESFLLKRLQLQAQIVCEASYQLLKDKYLLEKRGLIQIKGKGEMMTYILKEINLKIC